MRLPADLTGDAAFSYEPSAHGIAADAAGSCWLLQGGPTAHAGGASCSINDVDGKQGASGGCCVLVGPGS